MSDPPGPTEALLYEHGKMGRWREVLAAFNADPALARRAVRYAKPTSHWTLLHQAAYWGNTEAIAKVLEFGGSTEAASRAGDVARQVAEQQGMAAAAALLASASAGAKGNWRASEDATLMPASCSWGQARRAVAAFDMQVAYAGGVVRISQGQEHYVDDFGRTLVGWHGSYKPPRGMDGESMLR